MSVVATMTLPQQGATGVLRYTPLGGNGMSSPKGMYQLRNFAVTGDVSGGSIKLQVVMDDRFCCMVAYATMLYAGTGTDPMPIRWLFGGSIGGISPDQVRQVAADVVPTTVGGDRVQDMWVPPAFVHGSDPNLTLEISTINEDGDVLQLHASIFVFDINARQRVPFELLVASRGGGIL